MLAIDKLISIAKNEIGYLEKRSLNSLYDKTANAGSANLTKYWADILPSFQGEPWCACFVTWVFVKAFGKSAAETLLKHYPYTYVPTIVQLFKNYSSPEVGDIACFYKNGKFAHTGIVIGVGADKFTTIEGNTSGASEIIENGGGVCQKTYTLSKYPNTKFVRPDYSGVEKEEEKKVIAEYEKYIQRLEREISALNDRVNDLEKYAGIKYAWVDENMPEWARSTISKLVENGSLKGDGPNGELNLSYDDLRFFKILDRMGLFK